MGEAGSNNSSQNVTDLSDYMLFGNVYMLGYVPYWCSVVFIFFNVSCFIVGVIGNIIIIIIYHKTKPKTPSDWFILFIAYMDFIVCSGHPWFNLRVELAWPVWDLFGFMCSLEILINFTAMLSSCFLMGLMAMDRYIKVCRPSVASLTGETARYICCACVAMSLALCIYPSSFHLMEANCIQLQQLGKVEVYYLVALFCIFCTCFVVVTLSYGKVIMTIEKKIKVKKRLLKNDGLHSHDNRDYHSNEKGGHNGRNNKSSLFTTGSRLACCSYLCMPCHARSCRCEQVQVSKEKENNENQNENENKESATCNFSNQTDKTEKSVSPRVTDHLYVDSNKYDKLVKNMEPNEMDSEKVGMVQNNDYSDSIQSLEENGSRYDGTDLSQVARENKNKGSFPSIEQAISSQPKASIHDVIDSDTRNTSGVNDNKTVSPTTDSCKMETGLTDSLSKSGSKTSLGTSSLSAHGIQSNLQGYQSNEMEENQPFIDNGNEPSPRQAASLNDPVDLTSSTGAFISTDSEDNNIIPGNSSSEKETLLSVNKNSMSPETEVGKNKMVQDNEPITEATTNSKLEVTRPPRLNVKNEYSDEDTDEIEEELYSDVQPVSFFLRRAKEKMTHLQEKLTYQISRCPSSHRRKKWMKERKMTMMLFCLTFVFLVSWIPPWALYLCFLFNYQPFASHIAVRISYRFWEKMTLIQYCTNFIIYTTFNPSFRKKMKALFVQGRNSVMCGRCKKTGTSTIVEPVDV